MTIAAHLFHCDTCGLLPGMKCEGPEGTEMDRPHTSRLQRAAAGIRARREAGAQGDELMRQEDREETPWFDPEAEAAAANDELDAENGWLRAAENNYFSPEEGGY